MQQVSPVLLEKITRRLVNEFQPERILLFGSHAWGEPTEDSDLDLLVIVPESDAEPADRATRAHRCLGGIAGPTDILVKTRLEVERYRPVRASLESLILERGKLLYERG